MIRFEMSEYVNLSGGERLIGGQPGGESLLNCWVRQSPFQSCWMRNLERTQRSFIDLLLLVWGEVRLFDSRGRITNLCELEFSPTRILKIAIPLGGVTLLRLVFYRT